MNDWKGRLKKLETIKYPALILLVGLLLMLIPLNGESQNPADTSESVLEQVLAASDGVGRIRVIVSENGAVVVCDGAGNAGVRLDILHAIGSYTGFGSDKITVLKMSD